MDARDMTAVCLQALAQIRRIVCSAEEADRASPAVGKIFHETPTQRQNGGCIIQKIKQQWSKHKIQWQYTHHMPYDRLNQQKEGRKDSTQLYLQRKQLTGGHSVTDQIPGLRHDSTWPFSALPHQCMQPPLLLPQEGAKLLQSALCMERHFMLQQQYPVCLHFHVAKLC